MLPRYAMLLRRYAAAAAAFTMSLSFSRFISVYAAYMRRHYFRVAAADMLPRYCCFSPHFHFLPPMISLPLISVSRRFAAPCRCCLMMPPAIFRRQHVIIRMMLLSLPRLIFSDALRHFIRYALAS